VCVACAAEDVGIDNKKRLYFKENKKYMFKERQRKMEE
jgi:hypothetical protein